MTRFAQKTWSRVFASLGASLPDVSLEAAYSFNRDGSEFYDYSKNNFSMTKGTYWTNRHPLLGAGITARAPGDNTGVLNATINPSTDNHTVSCWLIPRKAADANTKFIIGRGLGGANYSFSPMGGLALTTNPGIRYAHYTGAAYQLSSVVPIPLKPVHLVYTIDHTNTLVSVYVDSHLAATVANTTITSIAPGDGFRIADDNNASALQLPLENFGEVVEPRIFSEVKDQNWVTAEYQKGARAIQFKTDWGIKADGVSKTTDEYFADYMKSYVNPGRIVTKTINGKLVKAVESLNANFFTLGRYIGVDPVEAAYGSWSWWQDFNGIGGAHAFILTNDLGIGSNFGYFIAVGVSGSGGLYKLTPVQTLIEAFPAGSFDLNNPNHIHVIRTYDNRFIVYSNGSALSAGTVDSSYTECRYFSSNMPNGAWTALSDEKGQYAITKYLGVVPPTVN